MTFSPETLGLRSRLLDDAGFRHAFFTRLGGVSEPPFDSLNFSSSVGDDPELVHENCRRAAEALGVAVERLYFLSQVHGTQHHRLEGDEDPLEVLRREGDITLSTNPEVACGVRMADCPAVLIGDLESGAVVAVHSGWRGTVAGAVPAGVAALREVLGGPGDLVAAVGPHIEQCCFEVGADVAATIAAATAEGEAVVDRRRAKPHVDLRRVIARQLADLGVARVDHVAGCTMCDAERFHSYRRDGAVSGRMLGAIVAAARASSASMT
ncbi:MAG: peptidoglycan editing factor PgeF [Myxococcales bacterium]|nr:peptidoglycan editing factor PgeF [Myxococcales bacterium]